MLAQVLDELVQLHPKRVDLSLGRIKGLLARLGHPQEALPPVVHIAGTNGKGSSLALTDGLLRAAGLRAHAYTSPHLVHFSERLRLAGAPCEESALIDALRTCQEVNGGRAITFFEIVTAAAFLLFSRHRADITLLETGLGGRLDATNVVTRPAVTAITCISFDHTEYLGTTITAIAREKAGIMRPDVPCVIAPQRFAGARTSLTRYGQKIGAPLDRAGQEWSIHIPDDISDASKTSGVWQLQSGHRRRDFASPSLAGRHQLDNAATAVRIVDHLHAAGLTPPPGPDGLARAVWPGRLQRITLAQSPSPPGGIWLDGGHNDSAGAVLADWLADQPARAHGVISMLTTKDPQAFLAPLAPYLAGVAVAAILDTGGDEAVGDSRDAITAAARALGIEVLGQWDDPKTASQAVLRDHRPRLLLICGSLYACKDFL
ncbi:MAG: folylpolyglutamate synthase/dihydrofolate synthase family protein [Pseudomonadota bacterium]